MGLFGIGKYSQRAIDRDARELGLRPATMEEKYGDLADLKVEVDFMAERGRLAEFEPVFRELWASKALVPDGSRAYSFLAANLDRNVRDADGDLDAVEQALAGFEELYRRSPTAFTAGLYADALGTAAFEARGRAWASDTSESQWNGMRHYSALAEEVLRSVEPGDEFVWWSSRFSAMLVDGTSPQTRKSVAQKLISLDPENIHTYQRMAHHALPRWHGTDAHSIDRVARRAMEGTRALFGAGGYGLTYWFLTDTGGFDVTDTVMDVDLAAQGFRELYERRPSVPALNIFARTMSWGCNESAVLEAFGAGLEAVVPMCWDAEEDDEAIDLAARAHIWARHNA